MQQQINTYKHNGNGGCKRRKKKNKQLYTISKGAFAFALIVLHVYQRANESIRETLDFERPESKMWTLDSATEIIHTFCAQREYSSVFFSSSLLSFALSFSFCLILALSLTLYSLLYSLFIRIYCRFICANMKEFSYSNSFFIFFISFLLLFLFIICSFVHLFDVIMKHWIYCYY